MQLTSDIAAAGLPPGSGNDFPLLRRMLPLHINHESPATLSLSFR